MADAPQDTKFWLFGMGPKRHAQMAFTVNMLGLATTILGLVSAAIKRDVGLSATVWLLLTIVFFIWGISDWLVAYFGAKAGYTR